MQKYLKTVLIRIFFGLCFLNPFASADDLNDDRSVLDRPEFDPNTPSYQLTHSTYSIGVRFGLHGFPNSADLGDLYQGYGEWVMPFQSAGVFSVGAHLGVFALRELGTALPYPNYQNMLSGFQLRYQLKIWPNQIIVPTAQLEADYYHFVLPSGTSPSSLNGTNFGASYGVFLNLGWFDPITAKDAFQSLRLTKTYLTVEVKPTTLKTDLFKLNGSLILFGMRTEFY